MIGSLRLRDYPSEIVRVSCEKCGGLCGRENRSPVSDGGGFLRPLAPSVGRSNEPEGNRCCFADRRRTGIRTRSKSESRTSEQGCRRRRSQLGCNGELSCCR